MTLFETPAKRCAAGLTAAFLAGSVAVLLLQLVLPWGFVLLVTGCTVCLCLAVGGKIGIQRRETAILTTLAFVSSLLLNVLFPFGGSPFSSVTDVVDYNFMMSVFSVVAFVAVGMACIVVSGLVHEIYGFMLKRCESPSTMSSTQS